MNFNIYDFTLFTQGIDKFLYENLTPFWASAVEMTIIGLVFLIFYALVALFLIYAERKVCAFMQNRVGPNRVGSLWHFSAYSRFYQADAERDNPHQKCR